MSQGRWVFSESRRRPEVESAPEPPGRRRSAKTSVVASETGFGRLRRSDNTCCVTPPCLWSSVTAVIRNQYEY